MTKIERQSNEITCRCNALLCEEFVILTLNLLFTYIFVQVQHNGQNQGRCGVCGEEFSNPNKKFEPSPANEFATGLIVGEYQQGETSKS